jgi:hypothetical protein
MAARPRSRMSSATAASSMHYPFDTANENFSGPVFRSLRIAGISRDVSATFSDIQAGLGLEGLDS